MARIDYIVAALEKAGVPYSELQHFKEVVTTARTCASHGADAISSTESGVIAEGTLERLRQGNHGFAAIWRPHWVRLVPGEIQVFGSRTRPSPSTRYQLSLPLSVQQTTIEIGAT